MKMYRVVPQTKRGNSTVPVENLLTDIKVMVHISRGDSKRALSSID